MAQVFKLNKSPLLIRWLIIIHSLTAFSSLANALIWPYKLIVLLMVGYSLFFYLRYYQSRFQPYEIRYSENLIWQLAIGDDDFQAIEVLPSSVITVWLIVLHFRLGKSKQQRLVIFNDALDDKDYRALAVALKIAGL